MRHPNRSLVLCWGVLLAAFLAIAYPLAAQDVTPESPSAWISPTPDENGVISVVVQPDESLWAIAARAGLTLPEILALNNLTENDVIRPGDVIIIGTGTPPPTAISPEMLTPTATPPPPTLRPTLAPPAATICLTAFEDTNRNGFHDDDEPTNTGVAFTVFNHDAVVANVVTDGRAEPHCLSGLTPGEYYVTRSILPGEILTTDGDWALVISDDSTLFQAFGSVRTVGTPVTTPTLTGSVATPAGNVSAVSSPPPTQSAVSTEEPEPGNNALLWAGAAALFVGGLLLLSAVLILLLRRTRAGS
ncbi:MAG: LysM peptidoglycan-binding domain-containing protein [Chloroflexota bacterium]